jgi:hypothetical protein
MDISSLSLPPIDPHPLYRNRLLHLMRDDGLAYDTLAFHQAIVRVVRSASRVVVKSEHNAQLRRARADGFANSAQSEPVDCDQELRRREFDHEAAGARGPVLARRRN